MSIYKCKMCGGALEISGGESVAVCEYCGTKQTVPRLDDEKRANLYDRANHFFRNDEFDKAMGIYEQILSEDKTDAEAYWSIVLCRYGVEYVEDPATHKRVPTVNRTQFASIFSDEDYKSALEYADGYQKSIYEEQAKIIDKIQKDILAISQQEEPFDVFICYKESDNGGRRTPDSVLANELYHELTEEGFKVFYSRITLEDKIGTAYEPYIFSALNSAKVMVVLGTRAEYFQAAWVKNEWSRYLALIRNGEKKMLIPAYRDMDPYDLPEEFSHLQAQDMSKLGFMQDLVRGIKKIAQVEEEKPVVVKEVVNSGSDATVSSLLKRVFLFLEDGDFENADEYCERVLDIEPECGEAYLGKLMVELRVEKREKIADCSEPFEYSNNYKKILRFGETALIEELKGYNAYIVERNEQERKRKQYVAAVECMKKAETQQEFEELAKIFEGFGTYEEAENLAAKCHGKVEECRMEEERRQREEEERRREEEKRKREKAELNRKKGIYASAMERMGDGSISSYELAIEELESISGWIDVDEKIILCRQKINEIREKEVARQRRKRLILMICIPLGVVVFVLFYVLLVKVIIPASKYNSAIDLYDEGKYKEAYLALKDLNERSPYKDSEEKARSIFPKYLAVAQEGDIITFGRYEQDNNIRNGEEEIEWVVYRKEDSSVHVISRYVLDFQPYDRVNPDAVWPDCSLQEWLNGTFLEAAFNEEEQSMIEEWNSDGNKVAMLNTPEIRAYFLPEDMRDLLVGDATRYVEAYWHPIDEPICYWWFTDNERGAGVIADCNEDDTGNIVLNSIEATNYLGIRPTIEIRILDEE